MNIQRRKSDWLWLAIAHVRPKTSGILPDGAGGAHVPVFGLGHDNNDFVSSAIRLMAALEFDVVEIDEIKHIPFSQFKTRATNEMCRVAKSLNTLTPVGYGTFHTYPAQYESDR